MGEKELLHPFGRLKNVKIDLSKYINLIELDRNSELETMDGQFIAKTKKLSDEKYITKLYSYSLNGNCEISRLELHYSCCKANKTIEEAFQFHFDALNWLNENLYSIS